MYWLEKFLLSIFFTYKNFYMWYIWIFIYNYIRYVHSHAADFQVSVVESSLEKNYLFIWKFNSLMWGRKVIWWRGSWWRTFRSWRITRSLLIGGAYIHDDQTTHNLDDFFHRTIITGSILWDDRIFWRLSNFSDSTDYLCYLLSFYRFFLGKHINI